jgi:chitinase
VANTSAAENAGSMVFTVTLSSAPVFTPVTVQYATADGTATSPADYAATSGILTFNAGETTKTVNVPIVNDTLDEPDETFTLTLSNPTNAVIMAGQDTATGTIQDNDAAPTVSIAVVPTATEPDTGSVNQTVTVTLSAASSLPVSVIIHTISGTANENVDFTANAAYLTFSPGQTVQTFNVAVLGDTLDENDERYTVQLLSPTNAMIGTGSRVATIADNDPPPNLSISDVSATEGNTLTKKFNFTLTLSAVSGRNVQVFLNTANGSATAPTDYVARTNVNVAIPVGTTSATFTVSVKGDTVVEGDETFFANIDTGQTTNSVVVDGQGIGTILNDD